MSKKSPKSKVTHSIQSRAMWCEICQSQSVSKKTTFRTYGTGRQVKIEICEVCQSKQETESFSEKFRIKNEN